MSPTKFDKPPVQSSSSGIPFVRAADILASKVGREQIRSMAALAAELGLTHGEPSAVEPTNKG